VTDQQERPTVSPVGASSTTASSATYQADRAAQSSGHPLAESDERYLEPTSAGTAAWTGTALAGVLMIITGAYGFLAGLAMVIRGGFFVTHAGYAYEWTTRGWGWTELIIGALVFLAGVGVLRDMLWARVVGVLLATFYAVTAFLTLPFFPIWSIVLLAMNAFIIWALVARHEGREV